MAAEWFSGVRYPILDRDACGRHGVDPLKLLHDWRDDGLGFFQLRAKNIDAAAYLALASRLKEQAPSVHIIANDRLSVVSNNRGLFSGLHLGQEDLAGIRDNAVTAAELRRLAADGFLLGLSTHNAAQLVEASRHMRDDRAAEFESTPWGAPGLWHYLALGPCFETSSRSGPANPVLGVAGLRDCVKALQKQRLAGQAGHVSRLVLIGGLNVERSRTVFREMAVDPGCQVMVAAIEGALDTRNWAQIGRILAR